MKKKGFTLVELLATIVVLSVIALIATPIILNVIESAKKGALVSSVNGLVESANMYYTNEIIKGDANLVSANIKSGVTIFGVSGNSNVVDTSSGDAATAQILSGKKAYVDGKLVTGTMTNKSGTTTAASTITKNGDNAEITIPANGYYSTSSKISVPIETINNNLSKENEMLIIDGSTIYREFTKKSNSTITTNSGDITLTLSSTGYALTELIDVSDADYVVLECEVLSTNGTGIYFGLFSAMPTGGTFAGHKRTSVLNYISGDSNGVFHPPKTIKHIIDISDITGSYYIGIYANALSLSISKFYLLQNQ